jgi:DNA-binding transcriptional MocR family regulator
MPLKPIRIAQVDIPPEMIDFGSGQPGMDLLPLSIIRLSAEAQLGRNDPSFLAYGAEQGNGYFRIALAQFLGEHYHISVEPDDLFVTAGASQGLDLICTLFTRPGDSIFVEEPSYFLALRIFADHRLNVVSLPMDENGLIVEALEEKLLRHRPVFLYTVPTFHNPAGITLGADRREQLLNLSRGHNFLIIADEVYHLLSYDPAPPPPPLAAFVESGSILSLGSFSKIMAPGLRLGWIQTGAQLMKRFTGCGMVDSGGGLNPFASAVVCSAIELGLQQDQLRTLKTSYTQRKIALSQALREHLPVSVRFTEPGGGFFFWLEFPDGIDTEKMLAEAQHHNVGYLPGIKFSSCNGLQNYIRLSFSYYGIPQLEEGVRRLARVIRNYMER